MAVEGVDFSWGRPNLACLFNGGKRFAVRYVGHRDPENVNITKTEADRIHAAGMKVVIVYQFTKSFMLEGTFDDGYSAAKKGQLQALDAGMPITRPIYFALDTDPNFFTDSQWRKVQDWLLGASTWLGRERTGLYGGYWATEKLVPTFAKWGWQTYAWSSFDVGGQRVVRWSSKAHMQQYDNDVQLCGATVDKDRAVTTDYGQW